MASDVVLADRLPNPRTGELVDPRDIGALAEALDAVREKARELQELRRAFEEVLLAQAEARGTKTLHDGKWKAEVTGGPAVEYENPEELEKDLRRAGMPEETIREIVRETVTYSVSAGRAKRAAAANIEYAAVLSNHQQVVEKPYRVSVKRG